MLLPSPNKDEFLITEHHMTCDLISPSDLSFVTFTRLKYQSDSVTAVH